MEPMTATVREATESDQAALAALFTGLADEGLADIGIVIDPTPMSPEHAGGILSVLARQGVSLLLAECSGTLAGFLLLTRPDDSTGTHYRGLTMAVARDYRRQGIGSALLAAAQRLVETCREDGLLLTVYKNNEPAIRLYERFGFEMIDETETDRKMRWRNHAMQADAQGSRA
jgi:ribosomal protein S18 acetylase RimI-like enzyme